MVEKIINSLPIDINHLRKASNITTLRIQCYLKSLHEIPDLSQFHCLVSLDLSHNRIRSLEGIEKVSAIPNIQLLDLSYNKIKSLKDFHLLSLKSTLRKVNLSHNLLSKIELNINTDNLSYLDFSSNQISEIVSIQNLHNLEFLDLSENNLLSLRNVGSLPRLRELSLDSNPIRSFSDISGLTELQFIRRIPYSNFTNLERERAILYLNSLGFNYEIEYGEVIKDDTQKYIKYLTFFREPSVQAEYKISKHISLKLKENITRIYIDDKEFRQCIGIYFENPHKDIKQEEIHSIDSAEELLNVNRSIKHNLSSRELFWGHCSNIQAWVENNYDTRILHRNLAFPLLKSLADLEDSKAEQIFKEEIVKRYNSGDVNVKKFLIVEKYLV